MTVTLVYMDRLDVAGDVVETHSTYNTVEEALLQAAHNEMVTPGISLRIEKDGKKVAGPVEFKRALKAYRVARNEALTIDDAGVVTHDTTHHVTRMKGLVG
jgi:hypothetical protein